jgi:hypothetical protein
MVLVVQQLDNAELHTCWPAIRSVKHVMTSINHRLETACAGCRQPGRNKNMEFLGCMTKGSF